MDKKWKKNDFGSEKDWEIENAISGKNKHWMDKNERFQVKNGPKLRKNGFVIQWD